MIEFDTKVSDEDLKKVRVTITATMTYGEWMAIDGLLDGHNGAAFQKFGVPLGEALSEMQDAMRKFYSEADRTEF